MEYVRENPGQGVNAICQALGWGKHTERLRKAREAAGGLIRTVTEGSATLHYPGTAGSPPAAPAGAMQLPVVPGAPGSLAYLMPSAPTAPAR